MNVLTREEVELSFPKGRAIKATARWRRGRLVGAMGEKERSSAKMMWRSFVGGRW